MCASHGAFTKPHGAVRAKSWCDPASLSRGGGRNTGPSALVPAEFERTRWYPKDGELCLSRLKPEETLVEDRSASDVQIDRLTRV